MLSPQSVAAQSGEREGRLKVGMVLFAPLSKACVTSY